MSLSIFTRTSTGLATAQQQDQHQIIHAESSGSNNSASGRSGDQEEKATANPLRCGFKNSTISSSKHSWRSRPQTGTCDPVFTHNCPCFEQSERGGPTTHTTVKYRHSLQAYVHLQFLVERVDFTPALGLYTIERTRWASDCWPWLGLYRPIPGYSKLRRPNYPALTSASQVNLEIHSIPTRTQWKFPQVPIRPTQRRIPSLASKVSMLSSSTSQTTRMSTRIYSDGYAVGRLHKALLDNTEPDTA